MAKEKFDKKGVAKSLYMDGNYTQEEIANMVTHIVGGAMGIAVLTALQEGL